MKSEHSTDRMMNHLMSESNFSEFLSKNKEHFIETSLSNYITHLIKIKDLETSQIINKSNIERSYFYQIVNGRRIPSRDKLVQLALGMGLNVYETQTLLKIGEKGPLYPKVKRDAAIIYGLKNDYNYIEIQELLYELNERLLGD